MPLITPYGDKLLSDVSHLGDERSCVYFVSEYFV